MPEIIDKMDDIVRKLKNLIWKQGGMEAVKEAEKEIENEITFD